MVREAETLKSLNGLNVSARTRACLEKNFDSIDDVIKYGRCLAYDPNSMCSTNAKWESELTSAIKEAGFVRPKTDFAMSLRIGFLYASIFPHNGSCFIFHISQLSNEQYESFVGISDKDIENVRLSLFDRLAEREYEIICRYFGLFDRKETLEQIGELLGITGERVRGIKAETLRKLRYSNTLPALFDAPSELNAAVRDLRSELDKLHQDPVFKRERELLTKLERMKKLPLRYSDAASGQLDLNAWRDSMPIEKLGLCASDYNCLKRAGIDTISDILDYPKYSWFQIKNINSRILGNVEEKMRSAGYENFIIPGTRRTGGKKRGISAGYEDFFSIPGALS